MARLASLLLLGAAAASAHPGHGHNHARAHQKPRNDGDTITALINGEEVSWTQEGDYYSPAAATPAAVLNVNVNVADAASTPATSTAATTLATSYTASYAAVATGSESSSSSSSSSSTSTTGYTVDTYTPFSDITCSSSKRATLAEIAQVGNVGGSCYGSNYLVITDEAVAEQYNNTIRFYGATEDMTCAYWNKIAKDGSIGGWYKSLDSYATFDLAAGATVYVAADDGSQGAGSCFPASTGIETDSYGAIGGTWVEWTFVDVTTGWSAYDASSIIAQNGDLTVNGVEVCLDDGATCSAIGAAMSAIINAFDATLAAADGIGGNVEGCIKIKANFGY